MRVLVVSGFLGSGKTTFIQEMARRCGRDFVVYENEFGEADIDARRLLETEELSVWESTENCICCSGKQDFAASVLTISSTLDPEYLVVEPTGVARLSSVVENIEGVRFERISLLEPVCIVDACAWSRQRERFADIYADQVASAGTVVVSKTGLAGAGDVEAVRAWVSANNPDAQVVARPYDQLPDSFFLDLLERHLDPDHVAPAAPDAPAAEDEFESVSFEDVSLPTEGHLLWLLDALVAGAFGEVVRAKGALPCGDRWLRFDVVDRAWSVTGAEEAQEAGERPVAVFIGPSVRRPPLRAALVPAVRDAVLAGDARAAEDDGWDLKGHDHDHDHDHHHDHGHDHGRGRGDDNH